MSTLTRRQLLLGGALLPAALGTAGCGYLLYPGRQGRRGGEIDAPILIVDLLWLIPGFVPGIICLAVDFGTGCIYRGEGRRYHRYRSAEERDRHTAFASVILDGEVVASAQVLPDASARLAWSRQVDPAKLKERGQLVLTRPEGGRAEALLRALC